MLEEVVWILLENPLQIPVLITCCPMALKHQALNPEHQHGWLLLEVVLFIVYMWRIAGVKIIWGEGWGQQFY